MVKINPPPPAQTPNPIYVELPEGQRLQRIYDPTRHNTQALTFRYFGSIARFDHHRAGNSRKKNNDPERGVYYAAFTLSGCLVEVFGDTGVIEIKATVLRVFSCRAIGPADRLTVLNGRS
ncbi:RES family NAD+ phosphorylase [Gloeobacter kilaueensis]|uniref:RES domain-containing protein n=1 Tax=Gloeobacter kilaueensis (strain ATCC BAA-2537 / CCAP 1431/1 / ULC 316 / JS1) TaxID=1183438 RepID=U5QMF9_GLOK1|nr:RES family NAD+ phosphorylase [Gloeobacter kilaueensis]AGY60078.1 RES domain-containing protein [Gloeobacter kilaueensis JS1]